MMPGSNAQASQSSADLGDVAAEYRPYGEVEVLPLSKIQSIVARNLSRSWTQIPHVTHHDELDITVLEQARPKLSEASGFKLTVLPFVIKAVAEALKAFPQFNASLDASGQHLIFKKFYNVGVAVDTPKGLFVPVVRAVDELSVQAIAEKMASLVALARGKGLPMSEMSGASFSVSSLGSVGGTGFTPIINLPEVAILGLTRTRLAPRPTGSGTVEWRSMLPVSLSYDHRVINGADAARFCRFVETAMESGISAGHVAEP